MFAKDGVRNMQLQHCSSKPDSVPFELPELLGLSRTPKGLQPPHIAPEQMLTGVVPEASTKECEHRERERESERGEARRGEARRGEARRGEERRGEERRGEERRSEESTGKEIALVLSCFWVQDGARIDI